jgi:hypothetical protein
LTRVFTSFAHLANNILVDRHPVFLRLGIFHRPGLLQCNTVGRPESFKHHTPVR